MNFSFFHFLFFEDKEDGEEDDPSRCSPDVLPKKEEGEGAGEAEEMGAQKDDLSRCSPDVLPKKEKGEGAGEADEMGAGPPSSSSGVPPSSAGVPPSAAAVQGLIQMLEQSVDNNLWFQEPDIEALAIATTMAMEVGEAASVDSAEVGRMSKAERAQHEENIWRTTDDLNAEKFRQKIVELEKNDKVDSSVFGTAWFAEVKQKANSKRGERRKKRKEDAKEAQAEAGVKHDNSQANVLFDFYAVFGWVFPDQTENQKDTPGESKW